MTRRLAQEEPISSTRRFGFAVYFQLNTEDSAKAASNRNRKSAVIKGLADDLRSPTNPESSSYGSLIVSLTDILCRVTPRPQVQGLPHSGLEGHEVGLGYQSCEVLNIS